MSRSCPPLLLLALALGPDLAGGQVHAQANISRPVPPNRPVNRPPANVPPGPPNPLPPAPVQPRAKPSKPRAGGNAGNVTRGGGVINNPRLEIQRLGGGANRPAPTIRSADFIPVFDN